MPADKLDFPEDSEEVKFDLSEGEVLGRSLKELVEKTIVEKGLDSVEKGSTRKERVDGITTQKGEVRKVSVALYEIILEYKHKDYKIVNLDLRMTPYLGRHSSHPSFYRVNDKKRQ